MFKNLIIIIFSFSVYSSIFSQSHSINEESIDSIYQWLLDHAENDSLDIHKVALSNLTRVYKTKDYKRIAEYHDVIRYWHDYHGTYNYDSVVYHAEQTSEFYSKTNQPTDLADAYIDLAYAYMNNDQLEKARVVTFKAIQLLKPTQHEALLADAQGTMSSLQLLMGEPELSIQYGKAAYDYTVKSNDYSGQVSSSLNLIRAYNDLKEFSKAEQLAEENLQILSQHLDNQIGYLTRLYSFKIDASVGLNKLDQAFAEATKLWEIIKEDVGPIQGASYSENLADVLFLQKKYKEALDKYLFIIEHEKDSGFNIWEVYQKASQCSEKLGIYNTAYETQKESYRLKEKMLNEKITNLESEAFIKYETGKKDQAIETQKLQIKSKNNIQLLTLAIAGLLATLLLVVFLNFTKNKKTTAALKIKNDENELLLKEIHHRVKNNLEIVSSLLMLQGAQVKDKEVQVAMQASQNRVQAMGILHQKLYQGTNLGAIEMKEYFLNLSEGVLDSFNADQQIKIECVMNQLELDIDTAVPIGLIVNELLTNALKYAFPNGKNGSIKISLEEIDADHLLLKVADNGIGTDLDKTAQGTGFGSELIRLLSIQLGGTIDRKVDNGTIISLKLKRSKAA